MSCHGLVGRRLRTLLTTTALGIAGLTGTAGAAPAAGQDAPTIDTYEGWDGSSYGCLNRLYTTCGQVITIPEGQRRLRAFNFYLHLDGEATVRGEVYTWDGTTAVREVWESNRRTLSQSPLHAYPKLHFSPRAAVRPGKQYVLFLSFSKDYDELAPDTSGYIAAVPEDRLTDGNPADLDDAGDESQWTDRQWYTDSPGPWELCTEIWLR